MWGICLSSVEPLVSIIIAHRGPGMGLWCTTVSCAEDLRHSDIPYEFCICSNDDKELDQDTKNIIFHLEKSGKLGWFHHQTTPLSAPTARQMATQHAKGKYLAFFDNHITVGRDYFKQAVEDFEDYPCDVLHSTTLFYVGDVEHYHYSIRGNLNSNFWGVAETISPQTHKPYRIAVAGHGGFLVKKDVWEKTGGYPTCFEGYAGEEVTYNLTCALLDYQVFIDPTLYHTHWCGKRVYDRHLSSAYFLNLLQSANIIGGEKYLNRVMDHFSNEVVRIKAASNIFDIYEQAVEKSQPHADWLESVRKRTLDEQLEYFTLNNIPY